MSLSDYSQSGSAPLFARIVGKGTFASQERKDNNLTLLRFLAASAVLFSHSWSLSLGAGVLDPVSVFLSRFTDGALSLSGLAVNAFFVTSGYLVTKSAIRNKAGLYYWWSRVLRIYPALIVNILIVALVLGPVVTALPLNGYFRGEEFAEYLTNNIVLWNSVYFLPGVFTENPETAVNGSLWTLPVELRCYLAVGLMAAVGVFRFRALATILCAAILLVALLSDGYQPFGSLPAFQNVGYFILGAHFFLYREYIPASPAIALLLLLGGLFLSLEPLASLAAAVGFSWLILWAGLVAPKVISLDNSLGDPSYGIYIWAFPIQQTLVHSLGAGAPWKILLLAFPLTVAAGVLSWRVIEKPALMKKSAFAGVSHHHLKSLSQFFRKEGST